MEKTNVVGYRFCPTGEELVNYYLMNKILGNSFDQAINEINICDFEPEFLPSLSKIKSEDPVWYFFCRKQYASAKNKVIKRTTPSGFWKATGVDRKIKDRRGNGVEIGIKKTLVYYEGKAANGERTDWVMHEYHITCFPLNQRTYVICQVMYKGDDGDSLNGNNSNQLRDSMVIDSINTAAPEVGQLDQESDNRFYEDDLFAPMNEEEDLSLFNTDTFFVDNNSPYVQPQTPCDEEYFRGLLSFNGGNYDDMCPNTEIRTQANQNNHRPKKPLTGIIANSSSDSNIGSDAESISATSYRGTSSPGSNGSSSGQFHTSVDEILKKDSCKDIQTPAKTLNNRKTKESHFTRRTRPSKQELKEGKSKAVDASMDKKPSSSMVKTKKKGWFITEEAMQRNRKNPPYSYLMNMIIGFIILVAIIGNIKSVLLSVKT